MIKLLIVSSIFQEFRLESWLNNRSRFDRIAIKMHFTCQDAISIYFNAVSLKIPANTITKVIMVQVVNICFNLLHSPIYIFKFYENSRLFERLQQNKGFTISFTLNFLWKIILNVHFLHLCPQEIIYLSFILPFYKISALCDENCVEITKIYQILHSLSLIKQDLLCN
jgi:hypothetical protein